MNTAFLDFARTSDNVNYIILSNKVGTPKTKGKTSKMDQRVSK